MSKHTEGPWRVFEDKPWIVLMGKPSKLGNGEQYAACGGDLEHNEANARLIAAAPEMLAMLKRLEFDENGRCPCCRGESEGAYNHTADCELAALIAQAGGE